MYVRTKKPIQIMTVFGDGGYLSRRETIFGEMPATLEHEEKIGPEIQTHARVETEDRSLRCAWTQPVWR